MPLTAFTALSSFANAFVLIDDFTVGEYEKTFADPGTDVAAQHGLDPSHCAFGERDTIFRVGGNFFHRPVTFRIGQGEGKVFTDTQELGTSTVWDYGISRFSKLDFSNESEFRADLYTENPANRLADNWNLFVRDSSGTTAANRGWVARNGGIAFQKSGFSDQLDWAHIEFIRFEQEFDNDFGPHPFVYSVTKLYAVPEPASFLLLTAVGLLTHRRRSRSD